MGYDMDLDQPITSSGTYGCADTVMADDEVSKPCHLVKHQKKLTSKPDGIPVHRFDDQELQ